MEVSVIIAVVSAESVVFGLLEHARSNSTNVADSANLTLTGSTESYSSLMGSLAQVNMSKFSSESTNIQSKNTIAKVVTSYELPDSE